MPAAGPLMEALAALQPRLQQQLQALLPGLQVAVAASLGSTNTALLEAARATPAGQPCAPRLLVALQQTAGRGRLGRSWQAAPGASLTFSLALPLAPRRWDGLSLAVGLALAEALDPAPVAASGLAGGADAAPRIALKWPNDLWLADGPGRGRKLGGILIETTQVGVQRVCVIGVGLNIAAPAAHGLAAQPAWLQQLDPAWSVERALQRCAAPLLEAVLAFAEAGLPPLLERYAHRDLLRGQAVYTVPAGAGGEPALQGVARGIDADGALCLELAGGRVQRIVSGEVSVRLQPAPGAGGGQPADAGAPAQAPDGRGSRC